MRFAGVLMGMAVLTACSGKSERDATRRASAELQRVLAGRAPAYVTAHHDGPRIWKMIRRFYADRRYAPAWIDGTKPRAQLDALLGALDGADRHGLDPELYDLGPLSQARTKVNRRLLGPDGFPPELVAGVDLRLTSAWLSYASDLATGVTARPHADPTWRIKPVEIDLLPVLTRALEEDGIDGALEELAPQHPEYRRLMEAHERYREQQKQLRDASAGGTRSPATAAQRKLAAELRTIELNLERWRWFPRDLGERHIRVNVPEYHLQVREQDRVAMEMKVIVGTKDKPTPIFSDTMTTIVFAPFWNVPASIAAEETLPAVMVDPEYLTRNNIEVLATSGEVVDPASVDWTALPEGEEFPYRFRQRPGTANSLGLVKFLFPNDFDVYLHDTPSRTLFDKENRALSHGCVRIQDPVRLAEYLLADSRTWNGATIQKAMHSEEEQHVKLPSRFPVHLMYWTARVDEGGNLLFFRDIYGHDARQWADYQSRINRVKRQKAAVPRSASDWTSVTSRTASAAAPRRGRGAASIPRQAPPAGTASR